MRRLVLLLLTVLALAVGCDGGPPSPPARLDPATLTNGPRPGVDYVAIVGDSFSLGSNEGGSQDAGWPAIVYTRLKEHRIFVSIRMDGLDSSGWVESSRKDGRAFAKHVMKAAGREDRIVVLFGGRDIDADVPQDQLAAAVTRTLALTKDRAPSATIVVVGPTWTAWPHESPRPDVLSMRDTIRQQVETLGGIFVDPIADRWFADGTDYIGADGTNPTNEGHIYMADRIEPLIERLLRP